MTTVAVAMRIPPSSSPSRSAEKIRGRPLRTNSATNPFRTSGFYRRSILLHAGVLLVFPRTCFDFATPAATVNVISPDRITRLYWAPSLVAHFHPVDPGTWNYFFRSFSPPSPTRRPRKRRKFRARTYTFLTEKRSSEHRRGIYLHIYMYIQVYKTRSRNFDV